MKSIKTLLVGTSAFMGFLDALSADSGAATSGSTDNLIIDENTSTAILSSVLSSTTAAVRTLSVAQVQDLLVDWGLDAVFGQSFQHNHINGAFLLQIGPNTVDETSFEPAAQKFHFAELYQRLDELKAQISTRNTNIEIEADGATTSSSSSSSNSKQAANWRRLSDESQALNIEGYSGVFLRRDKSAIVLGSNGDVSIHRTGGFPISMKLQYLT